MTEEKVDELFKSVSEEGDLKVAVELISRRPTRQSLLKAEGILKDLMSSPHSSQALQREAHYQRALALFLLDDLSAAQQAIKVIEKTRQGPLDEREKKLKQRIAERMRTDQQIGAAVVAGVALVGVGLVAWLVAKKKQ